jgi:aldehyde dehydrogenase (NAD+)
MTSQQQLDAHFEICFGLFSISFLHTSSYTSLVLSRIFFSTMGIENGGYESVEEIQATHSTLVRTFQTGKTKDIAWRKWQLKQLWWLVEENEQAIVDAIKSDLNRPGFETYLTDLAGIRKDILYHLENIDAWAADEPLGDSFMTKRLGLARIRKEPLGVALIIGAWNFPVLLVLQPLIAAITAGCCAIIKPSELTTACQTLVRDLITQYLDSSAIRVVCGGVVETTKLLELPFNHIFFTGSASVGRHISAAAAKHLTPVTLELGGQSPAIIGKSADLDRAAKTIAFSKFLNAGQICLAVNHVFVDPAVHDTFVEKLKHWSSQFLHGERKITTAIVNQRHWDRLSGLLQQTKGTVVCGGGESDELCRMEPTVVTDLDIDGKLSSAQVLHSEIVLTCVFRPVTRRRNLRSYLPCSEIRRSPGISNNQWVSLSLLMLKAPCLLRK